MYFKGLLLFALTLGAIHAHKGNYVIMSPSKIRANMDFSVSVNILQATGDVTVTATIRGSRSDLPTFSGNGTFRSGVPKTLTLKIPHNLADSYYHLTVEGTGGLHFKDSTYLAFEKKQLSIFVQTDKGIYKPGDLVNFRVFGIYSNLKPVNEPMNISLFDAGGNKLMRWLQVTTTDGVYTGKYQLSSQPTLGDWKLAVQVLRMRSEKSFTVAEYVLPKFEVDVVLPSYVLSSDKDFTATIKAKYTYGKPVKGTADVTLNLNDDHYNVPQPTSLQVAIDGEARVTFPIPKNTGFVSYFHEAKLIVRANVTEEQTRMVMSGNATVRIYRWPVKLEFLKSNPKTFKPGLEYIALLKVSQPDGLPLTSMAKQITVFTKVALYVSRSSWYSPTTTISLPNVKISVPTNGVVAIPVQVPKDARDVSITAWLLGETAYLSLDKSHSPSNSYIQLSLTTRSKIKAGDTIDLNVTSTNRLNQLTYQVLSRGRIVKTGSESSQGQLVYPFSLVTDASMSPDARIVVYYVTDSGEIVADSISFHVEGAFLNKVSVQVGTTQAKPGETVEVSVNADPDSVAHLMAIDQSSLLLKSGNDVTAGDVLNELKTYDTLTSSSHTNRDLNFFNNWWIWPVYYGGSDVERVLENSGVHVLTDCRVPVATAYYPVNQLNRVANVAKNVATSVHYPYFNSAKTIPEKPTVEMEKPTVDSEKPRVDFAETWLWTDLPLRSNGTASTSSAIPDTITSWVVSAFATNPVSGLGVAPTQAKLTVFKSFFVSLNLPYSVVRGEHLALQAIVFNYLQQDTKVRVSLAKSEEFFNVLVDTSGQERWEKEEVYQDITIKAGESKSVYFPIVPSQLGRINLEVSARCPVAADALRRQLLVEAEGVPKEYSIPVLVDLTDTQTSSFSKTVDLTLPDITVRGSELVRVSAVGDLMGPSIAGLDSLLRMPTGCGEQTMVGLAPDVYITDYLKAVNKLSTDIEEKALSYMESGYQRELTYKHEDGSFSAFGEHDHSGSMWLTAFVSRVFHQAKSHIFIDENVIKTAVNWMVRQQAANGSFPEPGHVHSRSLQSAAGKGVGLTCFVYISLLENQDLFASEGPGSPYQQATSKALAYLEAEINKTSDLYVLAMASYAFQLAGSPQAKDTLRRLEARATKEGGLRHWHKAEVAKANTGSWRPPYRTRAVDTEMTSYVLLAYAIQPNVISGKGIMQWVAQQRNPNGGFTSTQDTVVALQALSDYAKLTYVDNLNIHVTAALDSSLVFPFDIDYTNSLLVQTRETKTVPAQVKIDAVGNGTALVEVSVFFNVESEVEDLSFDLKVNMTEETLNWLVVETCARWLGEGEASGMAVQEFGIPSGFNVDLETITSLPILKRLETQNKKVVLYFDQIGKADVCITFRAERTSLVAKSQPAAVRIFDYYEPSDQITVFYSSQILNESTICEICPDCENCVIPSTK